MKKTKKKAKVSKIRKALGSPIGLAVGDQTVRFMNSFASVWAIYMINTVIQKFNNNLSVEDHFWWTTFWVWAGLNLLELIKRTK